MGGMQKIRSVEPVSQKMLPSRMVRGVIGAVDATFCICSVGGSEVGRCSHLVFSSSSSPTSVAFYDYI